MSPRLVLLLAALACTPSGDGGDDAPDDDTEIAARDTDDTDDDTDDDTETDVAETDAPDSDTPDSDAPDSDTPVDTDPGPPPTLEDCFGDVWGGAPPVDYASVSPPPVMGRHCQGTNHQDIQGVERVVYVGDSVTLGTPALQGTTLTTTKDWWRNKTADGLASRFGLAKPGFSWRNVNLVDGVALEMFSGDFATCAKFGARTDDLLLDPHKQLETCNPESARDQRTLVLMTMGGNDIFSLLEDVNEGVDEATLRATFELAVQRLRDAITWVKEPGRFPNGVYVVFANPFEFTDPDSAEDMATCPGAGLIGLSAPLRNPIVHDVLADAARAYLQLAVDTQTDLVFLGEHFCGHGFDRANPSNRCYRGPSAANWYDEISCEHPNAKGHAALTRMFLATVDE